MMQQPRTTYNSSQVLDRQDPPGVHPFHLGSQRTRPKRLDIFFHGFKTLKLIGALLADPHISLFRKLLFFGSIGGLLVLLFFPDALNEVVMSTIIPLAGTVLGVPLDAGFDWIAFSIALVSLLRFFPADLVAYHYRQIFG